MVYKIQNREVEIEPSRFYTPGDSGTRGGQRFHQQHTHNDLYRYSFVSRSTRKCNVLSDSITSATLGDFKAVITRVPTALTGSTHDWAELTISAYSRNLLYICLAFFWKIYGDHGLQIVLAIVNYTRRSPTQ